MENRSAAAGATSPAEKSSCCSALTKKPQESGVLSNSVQYLRGLQEPVLNSTSARQEILVLCKAASSTTGASFPLQRWLGNAQISNLAASQELNKDIISTTMRSGTHLLHRKHSSAPTRDCNNTNISNPPKEAPGPFDLGPQSS
ncbi:unnamed protein product [Pleuronectes platessa]|uniref:Uncharacterized protein n=1 Tax=Pleuronectes platessa TaxID=8262 RepID=A0A9N7UD43_PLEPL|nr:unnamed protein product [Pleuronectes platessa]